MPWLYGVARKVLANHHRGDNRRRARTAELDAEMTDLYGDSPDRGVELAAAGQAFRSLSDDDRELLSLLAWEGLDRQEIAAVLGVSRNAVRIRLHRARKRFSRALAEAGVRHTSEEPGVPARTRGRARRRPFLGLATTVALAAGAVVGPSLLEGGTGLPSSYAVTRAPDGAVTVYVRDFRDHASRRQIRIGDLKVASRFHPGPRTGVDGPLDRVHAAVADAAVRQPRGDAVDVRRVDDHDVEPLETPEKGRDVRGGGSDGGHQPGQPVIGHLQRYRAGFARHAGGLVDDGHQFDEVAGKVHVGVDHPERLSGTSRHTRENGIGGRRHREAQPAVALHRPVHVPHDVAHMMQAVDVAEISPAAFFRYFPTFAATVPELFVANLRRSPGLIREVCGIVADKAGCGTDDPRIRNAVGAVFGVVAMVWLQWAQNAHMDGPAEIDGALAHLETGLSR